MSEMKVEERPEALRNGTLADKGHPLGLLGGSEAPGKLATLNVPGHPWAA